MKLTIATVNKALKEAGINGELLKGNGYFYFWGPDFDRCTTTSVMVPQLNCLSLESWLHDAREFIDEANW